MSRPERVRRGVHLLIVMVREVHKADLLEGATEVVVCFLRRTPPQPLVPAANKSQVRQLEAGSCGM